MKRELASTLNPYFFHTGCYATYARAVFNVLADIGRPHINSTDHYLRLLSKSGKIITNDCYCSLDITFANIGRCRAIDNEFLLSSTFKTKKFVGEVNKKFRELLNENINILIDSISQYIKDEEEPFYIIPLNSADTLPKFAKSVNSIYENVEVKRLKAEEYFTIRRLKDAMNLSSVGRIDDPFILNQKELLMKELLNAVGEAETLFFNVLFNNEVPMPTQVSNMLPLRTDYIGLTLKQKRFDELESAFQHRLLYVPISSFEKRKTYKAIEYVVNTEEFKHMVKMFYEVERFTSVWWLMNDFSYLAI